MTRSQCPLPIVEDALAPYIHCREKTTRIRQILTHALTKHIQDDIEPSHLSLSSPSLSLHAEDPAVLSEGLYKQYLQALTAHRQAQERYVEIKAGLNQMLDENPAHISDNGYRDSRDSVRAYSILLRQRRQQRKLELIQDALTKLLDSEPDPSHTDIKFAVREELGEPPQPPVASFEVESDSDSKIDDLTFQLKKELIIAKGKFSEARNAKFEAENRARSRGQVDTEDGLSILRDARDELISWVEGELAKIPEEEVEASQVDISFMGDDGADTNGRSLSQDELSKQVQILYMNYLTARQRYISMVESTLDCAQKIEDSPNTASSATMPPARRQTITSKPDETLQASQLLPYLTTVSTITKAETQLSQQTSHLRRQLGLASEETEQAVQRLAGESLMVPQNSTTMSAWADASVEAKQKTESVVSKHLSEGEKSISHAALVWEGLNTRRNALASLKRDL